MTAVVTQPRRSLCPAWRKFAWVLLLALSGQTVRAAEHQRHPSLRPWQLQQANPNGQQPTAATSAVQQTLAQLNSLASSVQTLPDQVEPAAAPMQAHRTSSASAAPSTTSSVHAPASAPQVLSSVACTTIVSHQPATRMPGSADGSVEGTAAKPAFHHCHEEEVVAKMQQVEALGVDYSESAVVAEVRGQPEMSITGDQRDAQQEGATKVKSSSSSAAASNLLQNLPYDLEQLADVGALFNAHREWQTAVLKKNLSSIPAIKVDTKLVHGLGNRLPGIGTGFMLAVLTGRLFFLQSTVHEHLEMPLPCVWQEYKHLYLGVDTCYLRHFTKLANADLQFCGGPHDDFTTTLVQQPCEWDYLLPMLQINPTLKPYFDKFFPDGEVYSKVVQYLFKPTPVLQQALDKYAPLSENCLVGMHMRTKKPGTSAHVQQFAAIARGIAASQPGNIFLAADADILKPMQESLPGRVVWRNEAAGLELQMGYTTQAGNPGTELSAITDLFLLSKCKHVVLTPGSSLGQIAAALAGTKPVFATHGTHMEPFTNPWFWQSFTSEPCFVKAAVVHFMDTELAHRFRQEHPLFVYHNQCHFVPRDGPGPSSWECTFENCRD